MSKAQQEKEKLLLAMAQLDQVNRELHYRDNMNRRLLWQLVQKTGGTMSVELNAEMPALWKLVFSKDPTEKMLVLEALVMPDPTPAQIKSLADELRGTNLLLEEFLPTTDLKEYPTAYIEHALSRDHVIWHQDTWMDADIARKLIIPPDGTPSSPET